MLLRLSIDNLILVERCELVFDRGFNVITGETGSGKSVLVAALSLLLGERADTSLIRLGEEKATVEGLFSIKNWQQDGLIELLQEYSLEELLEEEELLLRREITAQGKSRAFINSIAVPLHLLRKFGERAVEVSTQHAYLVMKTPSFPLDIVDAMAPTVEEDIRKFGAMLRESRKLLHSLEQIEKTLATRNDELPVIEGHIQTIEQSQILEIDTHALFSEYSNLLVQKELHDTYSAIADLLDGAHAKSSPLSTLTAMKQLLEKKRAKQGEENDINALYSHISTSHAELLEANFLIRKIIEKQDVNMHLLDTLEQKLKSIEQVERKWGRSRGQVESALATFKERYDYLMRLDVLFEEHKKLQQELEENLSRLGESLHSRRKTIANEIEKRVQEALLQLNMGSSTFEIEVATCSQNEHGISQASFFITPNVGEKRVLLAQGASGGELARIFLALQALLSSVKGVPTILFDEVDANIGGITAVHVGRKLAEIGTFRQVIAITHFPQVAEQAHRHFRISKHEEKKRTCTRVEILDQKGARTRELERMVGTSL